MYLSTGVPEKHQQIYSADRAHQGLEKRNMEKTAKGTYL